MRYWWLLVIIVLGYAVFSFWRRSRQLSWQARSLAKKLDKLARQQPRDAKGETSFLRRIYQLIQDSLITNDVAETYKLLDLLKLAYGEGCIRPDEPIHLMTLAVSLVRQEKTDLAAALLDAYRNMLRRLPVESSVMAAEQLLVIGTVAAREKQPFLATKAAEILFAMLEKVEWTTHRPDSVIAVIRSLKVLGGYALRRQDTEFFREMTTRFAVFVIAKPHSIIVDEILAALSVWMHRILQTDNETLFAVLADFVLHLADRRALQDESIERLLREWHNLAGVVSLNPKSKLAAAVVGHILELGKRTENVANWTLAVSCAAKLAKLAVDQSGSQQAFPLIYPLLDAGRKFLLAELKFGENVRSAFRQKALFILVKECISLFNFAARQQMLATIYDVAGEFYQYWSGDPARAISCKSAKKFFQLLLLYWKQTRGLLPKKKLPADLPLMDPLLFSETDINRMVFLDSKTLKLDDAI
ncbi:hypothetical protein [Acetonema longum]|uniref:Uncharacterized protein n=1 Tax=Acetonema longum DSM 6540 TaxID=1009370 RepID=F7NQ72_9FIRM|nr:hypothetical protein [Acetonema longum]EGO61831.1 hypothetical protein ALO_21364 [Acetonema longum DSM 6540]